MWMIKGYTLYCRPDSEERARWLDSFHRGEQVQNNDQGEDTSWMNETYPRPDFQMLYDQNLALK